MIKYIALFFKNHSHEKKSYTNITISFKYLNLKSKIP